MDDEGEETETKEAANSDEEAEAAIQAVAEAIQEEEQQQAKTAHSPPTRPENVVAVLFAGDAKQSAAASAIASRAAFDSAHSRAIKIVRNLWKISKPTAIVGSGLGGVEFLAARLACEIGVPLHVCPPCETKRTDDGRLLGLASDSSGSAVAYNKSHALTQRLVGQNSAVVLADLLGQNALVIHPVGTRTDQLASHLLLLTSAETDEPEIFRHWSGPKLCVKL